MTILIFLIILGLLVFVHELGHFLAAKKAGVEVEEFGFGYPPRAMTLGKKWGTTFTLNWIPFGGFVKIFGENYEESFSTPPDQKSTDISLLRNSSSSPQSGSLGISDSGSSKKLSFVQVSKKWQAAILVAGVTFNILFAWFLFSLGFLIGLPTPVENSFGAEVKNPSLTIVGVLPESPASEAGLKAGDKIVKIENNEQVIENPNPEQMSQFINQSGEITVDVLRGKESVEFKLEGRSGVVEDKKAIGIEMDMVGTLSLPLHKALYQGGKATILMTYLTADGLFNLVKDAIAGKPDISQVTGPVGIVGLVGDASRLGFAYLITFTSLISINLAIINLIPFPALDGGRLLFVIVEGVTKKKISPKFAQIVNTAGFFLLIAVMLFVTYRDILNLI